MNKTFKMYKDEKNNYTCLRNYCLNVLGLSQRKTNKYIRKHSDSFLKEANTILETAKSNGALFLSHYSQKRLKFNWTPEKAILAHKIDKTHRICIVFLVIWFVLFTLFQHPGKWLTNEIVCTIIFVPFFTTAFLKIIIERWIVNKTIKLCKKYPYAFNYFFYDSISKESRYSFEEDFVFAPFRFFKLERFRQLKFTDTDEEQLELYNIFLYSILNSLSFINDCDNEVKRNLHFYLENESKIKYSTFFEYEHPIRKKVFNILINGFFYIGLICSVAYAPARLRYWYVGKALVIIKQNKKRSDYYNDLSKYNDELTAYNKYVLEKQNDNTIEYMTVHIKANMENVGYNSYVGYDWTTELLVDGNYIPSNGLTFTYHLGDNVTFFASATEHDKWPEYGHNEFTCNFNRYELLQGQTITIPFTVVENKGRYAGARSDWEASFSVKGEVQIDKKKPTEPIDHSKDTIVVDSDEIWQNFFYIDGSSLSIVLDVIRTSIQEKK